MSEADLNLKLRTARWFWALGASTLLRVRLTSFEAKPKKGKPVLSDLADLDVLGTEVASDFRLRFRTAECKSGKIGAKGLFWLRGVLDYFEAEEGYLVVQHDDQRKASMHELARRLGLGILTFNDFEMLDTVYADVDGRAAGALFTPETVAKVDAMLSTPDKRLERLTDYTLRSYWRFPQHRNLQQSVAYLAETSDVLDPRNPAHRLLFAELVYRYCLSLFSAGEAIIKGGLPRLTALLPIYLHGGELGLREAQQRIRSVETLQKELEGDERLELNSTFAEVPPYHDALLDLMERVLRRPHMPTPMLRHLQAAMHGAAAGKGTAASLLDEYDPIATKLVNDVAAFLVRTSGIDNGHRQALAAALNGADTEESGEDSAGPSEKPDDEASDEEPQLRIAEGSRSD